METFSIYGMLFGLLLSDLFKALDYLSHELKLHANDFTLVHRPRHSYLTKIK